MKEPLPHDPTPPVPYYERALTLRRLRRLLRNVRTGSIPSALAEVIRENFPMIHAPDAPTIMAVLIELVEEIVKRLENEGVIPEGENLPEEAFRLTTHERSQVISLSALLTWTADTAAVICVATPEGRGADRENLAETIALLNRRAITLARLADAPRQLAIALMVRVDHSPLLLTDDDSHEGLEEEAIALLENDGPDDAESLRLLLASHLRIANTYFTRGLIQQAEEHLEKITAMVESGDDDVQIRYAPSLHRLRAAIAARRTDLRTALVESRSALRLSDPAVDPITHAQILHTLGRIYEMMEHREEGLQSYLDAVTLLEETNLLASGPWVGFSAVAAYQAGEDYEDAERLLDRLGEALGVEDVTNLPDSSTVEIVSLAARRADLWSRRGEIEQAIPLFDWAIGQFHERDAPYNEAVVCGMAATTLARQGDHDEACTYLERAVAVSHRSSATHRQRFRLQLAEELLAADRPERAGDLLDEVEQEIDTDSRQSIQFRRIRSRLCELSGDLSEALRLEREAATMEQDHFSHDRKRSIRYGRIVAEINLLEQTIEKERDQKQRLEHALANAVVELGAKRETIEKIVEVLRQEAFRRGSDDDRAASTRLASMLASLRARQDSSSTLAFLGPAADEFIALLRADYPHLTTSQQRFCALIRFGYDSAEICSILDIGSEGLKSRRKRLRKGLGLQKGESLEEAVSKIGKG